MNVEYCTECGYKNSYALHAPNFCGGCGVKIGTSTATVKKAPTIKPSPRDSLRRQPREEVVEEEVFEEVPNISKLEYDIDSSFGNQKITIGDIMKEGPSKGATPRVRQGVSKAKSKEEILEESLKSCKSARAQPPEDVEG
jgi:hypothetical protein